MDIASARSSVTAGTIQVPDDARPHGCTSTRRPSTGRSARGGFIARRPVGARASASSSSCAGRLRRGRHAARPVARRVGDCRRPERRARWPFGRPAGTLRLRNVHSGNGRLTIASAIAAAAPAAHVKSKSPWWFGHTDTAMAGTPSNAASSAPATVPEYVTSSPRFHPLLRPDI